MSVPNGTYTIRNVQHNKSFVDLTNGLPYAAIAGWEPTGFSNNLRWIVENVGGDKITLENVTARGFYVSVYNFSNGAPVFSSPNPTYWTVRKVSNDAYTLTTTGNLQLSLTNSGDRVAILLGPVGHHNARPGEQQWKFEK